MPLHSEFYPYAFFKGKVTTFQPSSRFCPTYFGGPSDLLVIDGKKYGPRPLHHVMTINNRDLDVSGYDFGFNVPLFYGLCFDGCRLEYRRRASAAVEVLAITPQESSEDWPYPFYPFYLPYVQLEVKEVRDCSLQEFSGSVMQGIKSVPDDELVVIVPANPGLRMSVWGPAGDAESIQIIFRYDISTGITRAYNACT
jgi:hypothetical protein